MNASSSSSRGSGPLYIVFRVTDSGLQEMSSEAHPADDVLSHSDSHENRSADCRVSYASSSPGMTRNSFRHPKPCGDCSAKKSRCTPLPGNPSLCVRCNARGLSVCPPHVPWAVRKANTSIRTVSEGSEMPTTTTMDPLPEDSGNNAPLPSDSASAFFYNCYAAGDIGGMSGFLASDLSAPSADYLASGGGGNSTYLSPYAYGTDAAGYGEGSSSDMQSSMPFEVPDPGQTQVCMTSPPGLDSQIFRAESFFY